MDLPSLRHFRNDGIFHISSDPVDALVGEAWVRAIYTDKGWATHDGANLLQNVSDWRQPCQSTPDHPSPKSPRPRKRAAKSKQ